MTRTPGCSTRLRVEHGLQSIMSRVGRYVYIGTLRLCVQRKDRRVYRHIYIYIYIYIDIEPHQQSSENQNSEEKLFGTLKFRKSTNWFHGVLEF